VAYCGDEVALHLQLNKLFERGRAVVHAPKQDLFFWQVDQNKKRLNHLDKNKRDEKRMVKERFGKKSAMGTGSPRARRENIVS
jgi:hypothetical protein